MVVKTKTSLIRVRFLLCVCLTLKMQQKTNSKPTRFEFERKNKGAKYSFRRQAETERCELVLTCERATKRCISGGKNDQKYGIYPFDKLEYV